LTIAVPASILGLRHRYWMPVSVSLAPTASVAEPPLRMLPCESVTTSPVSVSLPVLVTTTVVIDHLAGMVRLVRIRRVARRPS